MTMNLTGGAVGGNVTSSLAGLTGLSGAATTYSTAALTIQYCVNGKSAAKAQVSGGATPTLDTLSGVASVLVASQAAVFVWGLNLAGTVQVIKGKTVPYTDTSANSTTCPFPELPDTFTPFAYSVIKAGVTTVGNWTFGTSNWNATGIVVDTPVNVFQLPPSDPLTA